MLRDHVVVVQVVMILRKVVVVMVAAAEGCEEDPPFLDKKVEVLAYMLTYLCEGTELVISGFEEWK